MRLGMLQVPAWLWAPIAYVAWVVLLSATCLQLGGTLVSSGTAVHNQAAPTETRQASRVEQELLAQTQARDEVPRLVRPPVVAFRAPEAPVPVLAIALDEAETVKRPVVRASLSKKQASARNAKRTDQKRAAQKLAQAKAAKVALAKATKLVKTKIAKELEAQLVAFLGGSPPVEKQRKKYLMAAVAADPSAGEITNRKLGVAQAKYE